MNPHASAAVRKSRAPAASPTGVPHVAAGPTRRPAPVAVPGMPAGEAGVADIAAALRERIAAGAWPLGTRLSDQAIAAELQVSRTPVREALLRLRAEGLVAARPQSGTFVFRPDAGEIAEICELRAVYEAGAAALALERDRSALLADLRATLARARVALEAGDLAALEACDTAFHEAIVNRSANRLLIEAYRAISGKVRALRHELPQEKPRFAAALAQHRRILAHLAAGRVAAAQCELREHLLKVETLLRAPDEPHGRMAHNGAGPGRVPRSRIPKTMETT